MAYNQDNDSAAVRIKVGLQIDANFVVRCSLEMGIHFFHFNIFYYRQFYTGERITGTGNPPYIIKAVEYGEVTKEFIFPSSDSIVSVEHNFDPFAGLYFKIYDACGDIDSTFQKGEHEDPQLNLSKSCDGLYYFSSTLNKYNSTRPITELSYRWYVNGVFVSDSFVLKLDKYNPNDQVRVELKSTECMLIADKIVSVDTSATSVDLRLVAETNVLCGKDSVKLRVVNTSGDIDQIRWNTGSTLDSIWVNSPGTYTAIGQNHLGCFDTVSITLNQTAVNYTRYDTICSYDSIRIGKSIYHQTGTYIDTILSNEGCDSILTTHLWVAFPIGLMGKVNDPTCHDHTDGSIDITVFDFAPGLRFFLNNKEITQVQLRNLSAGDYLIKVQNLFECVEEEKITLNNPTLISLDIGSDRLVNYADSLTVKVLTNLSLSEIKSILWQSTPDQTHCPDCLLEIKYLPSEDHFLKVILESLSGCKAEREINISTTREFKLFIPNIFWLDNTTDPKNQYLTVYGGHLVSRINYLRIYNRFGGQVYEAIDFFPNELNSGWDGKYKDEDAPQDVYIFVAEVLFTDGSNRIVKGDFLLLR